MSNDRQRKNSRQQSLVYERQDVVADLAAKEASELKVAIAELLVAALDDEEIGGSRDK